MQHPYRLGGHVGPLERRGQEGQSGARQAARLYVCSLHKCRVGWRGLPAGQSLPHGESENMTTGKIGVALWGTLLLACSTLGQRQMENLGRGELGIVAWGSQMTSSQDK